MGVATGQLSKALQHISQAALPQGAGLSNGQLLDRFIERRDEAAFSVLVRRHAALVWGVCRRVLGHHHDAEDAFQATFLVLAHKAASVRPREMVANWLYGVAYRTALKARGLSAKRRLRERQVSHMPEPQTGQDTRWPDLEPLLDQELACLPDKYRVAILLCDLQGKTRREVARQMKIPEGTLSSRLTTARTMLAKRLARHGLTLAGGLLGSLLSRNAAMAGAPASVVSSTIAAAGAFAAGKAAAGLVSIRIATLTQGVLKAMLLTKLKTTMCWVLGFVVLGGGLSMHSRLAAQQGQAEKEPADATKRETVPASTRAEVTLNPRSLDFGVVGRGQTATQTLDVEYTGDFDWRITEIVKSAAAPFVVAIEKRDRDKQSNPRRVGYRLALTLQDVTPPGSFKQELLIKTNDPDSPAHTVTVEGRIQDDAFFTTVKVGQLSYSLPFAFPSAEEILRALPKTEPRPKNPRIHGELIAYVLDEPRFVPLVGRVRLSHAHFRCTVIDDQGKTIVVYIDRDQLIPAK
jgi:RNA polymerase sigma factor (sigma-70 family)